MQTINHRITPAYLSSHAAYEMVADLYHDSEGLAKLPAYGAALLSTIPVTALIGVDILSNGVLYIGKKLYHWTFSEANQYRNRFYERDADAHRTAVVRAIGTVSKIFHLIAIPFLRRQSRVGKVTLEARQAMQLYHNAMASMQRYQKLSRSLVKKNAREKMQKAATRFTRSRDSWVKLAQHAAQKSRKELAVTTAKEFQFLRHNSARRIQRFWRRWNDYSGPFGEWYRKHRDNYVGHAINSTRSLEPIFKEGRVVPSELLWRQKKAFEYEGGPSFGDRLEFSSEDFNLTKIEKEVAALPTTRQRLTVLPHNIIFGEGNFKFWDMARGLVKKLRAEYPGIDQQTISLLRDELSLPEDRIDHLITVLFESLVKQGQKKEDAALRCHSIRELIVPASKLNFSVYCGRNCIYWGYGEVAVLRGNGSSVSSILWQTEENLKSYTQVCLKATYENNGQFFCMDLAQEDTLILGPRATLRPFRARFPQYRFLYIEELTSRQRRQLDVPSYLQAIPRRLHGTRDCLVL